MKTIFQLIAFCTCLYIMLNNAYSLDEIEEDIKRGAKTLDTSSINQSIIFSAREEVPETSDLPQETIKKRTSFRKTAAHSETSIPDEGAREEDSSNTYDQSHLKKRPGSIEISTSFDSSVPEAKKTKSPMNKSPKKTGGVKDKKALPNKTTKAPKGGASSADEKFPGIDVKFVGGQRIVTNVPK